MVVRSEHNFWAMPLELFDDWWVLVVQKGKLLLCFTQSRVATLGASNSSKNARGLANYPSCFTLEGPAIIQRFGRPNLERRWWANSSWWLLGRQNPLPWALATFPLVLLTHGCFVPAQCECRQHCAGLLACCTNLWHRPTIQPKSTIVHTSHSLAESWYTSWIVASANSFTFKCIPSLSSANDLFNPLSL